ncbi:MAG: putative Ig domain-containing protein, partial [Pseudomonadota bacterium]
MRFLPVAPHIAAHALSVCVFLGLVATSPLANALPECGDVSVSPSSVWPPSHELIPVTITVSGGSNVLPYCVMQDEALNTTGDGNTQIDAQISGSAASVRSERSGNADGRAYHVYFTATRAGAQCAGHALVTVPKSSNKAAVDGGPLYNSRGGTDCRTLTTNNPPTVLNGTLTTDEDVPATITLVANDPDGNTLTYHAVTSPQHGTLSGTFPNITYTPMLDFSGTDTFTWQVNDGTVDSAIATTTITVVSVNDAPAITSTPPTAATETVALSYAPQATDAEGDAVTWSLVSGPADATIVEGVFYWTPGYDAAGSQTVVLRATDGGGAHADQSFTLLVADTNRAPVFTLVPPTVAKALVAWTGPIAVVDPDGDAVDLVLVDAPAGMSLALMTGELVWSPTVADVGTHDVSVMAVDAHGAVTWHRFILTVEPADNHAPVITSLPLSDRNTEGVLFTYLVEATDADVGDVLSYELVDAPAGAQISLLTGLVTWTPTAEQAGLNSFRVRVSDTRGGYTEQVFTITVRGNLAPVWVSAPVTQWAQPEGYRYELNATDPEAQGVIYSLIDAPAGITLTGNVLAWDPQYTHNGHYAVSLRATDPLGFASDQHFTLDIGVRAAPYFTSTPPLYVNNNGTMSYLPTATDPNGGDVSIVPTAMPTGASYVDGVIGLTGSSHFAPPRTEYLPNCRAPGAAPGDFDFRMIEQYRIEGLTLVAPPLVAQMTDDNGDGTTDDHDDPDIVQHTFYSTSTPSGSSAGEVRIYDGKTGNLIKTIRHPQNRMQWLSVPAIADIDHDGRNDIVEAIDNFGVAVFRMDGSIIWSIDNATTKFINGSPSDMLLHVQDIDGDGHLEIIAGRLILNENGTVRAKLPDTNTANVAAGTVSLAADIDGDGKAEIIVGASVYNTDGTLRWRHAEFPNMYTSVGDFDGDGKLELFGVSRLETAMFDDDGTLLWRKPAPINRAGVPSVGDLDGDGIPEAVYASSAPEGYFVYAIDAQGNTRWRVAFDDLASGHSGVTLFDFNGDGLLEAVYADAYRVRIIDGLRGRTLWSIPHSNPTRMEFPVVADLDSDGSAELLVPGNGLQVLRALNNNWMPAPRIWPQYAVTDWKPYVGNRAMPEGTRVFGYVDAGTPLPDVGILGVAQPDVGTVRVAVISRGEVPAQGMWRVDVHANGNLVGSATVALNLASGANTAVDVTVSDISSNAGEFAVSIVPLDGALDCLASDNLLYWPRFALRATDTDGDVAEQFFGVTSVPINHAPVFSAISGDPDTRVGQMYIAQAVVSETDPGDALRYEIVSGPAGARIFPSGQIAWKTTRDQIGQTFTLRIAATDLAGARVEATKAVTVLDTPVAPVFTTVSSQAAVRGTDFSYAAHAEDDNPDDRIFYRLKQAPRGMTINSDTGAVHWPAAEMEAYLLPQDADDPSCTTLPDLVPTGASVERAVNPSNGKLEWHMAWTLYNRGSVNYPGARVYQTATFNSISSSGFLYNAGYAHQTSSYEYFLSDASVQTVSLDYRVTLGASGTAAECNQTLNNTAKMPFVMIEAVDSAGLIDMQPFFVNVRQRSNTSPTILSQPEQYVLLNSTWSYTLDVTDSDPTDTFYFSSSSPGLTLTKTGNTYSVTPTVAGDYPVTLIVSDSGGLSTQQPFVLHVIDPAVTANYPPVITSTPASSATMNQPFSYTLVANDPEGQPLTYAWPELPANASVNVAGTAVTWTPSTPGNFYFRALVTDSGGLQAQQSFVFTVADSNRAPTITSTAPTARVAEGDAYVYSLAANDADGDAIHYELASGPANATLTGNQLRWQTAVGDAGTQMFEVRAVDARGAWALQRFGVLVYSPTENHPPVVTAGVPFTEMSVGTLWQYFPKAVDPDGDALTLRIIQGYPNMQVFNGSPAYFQIHGAAASVQGKFPMVLGISDGKEEVLIRFTMTVYGAPPNSPPSIVLSCGWTLAPGVTSTCDLSVSDYDPGDSVTMTLRSAPTGVTLTGKQLKWTPTAAQAGMHEIIVRATDTHGAWTEGVIRVTVTPTGSNYPPVFTTTPPSGPFIAGDTLSYTATAFDPYGSAPLTYTMPLAPPGAVFNATTRTVTWETGLTDVGAHTLTLRVSDGVNIVEQFWFVYVNPPPPLMVDIAADGTLLYPGDIASVVVVSDGGYRGNTPRLYVNDQQVTLDANGVYRFTPTQPGIYRLRATATDQAGNIATKETTLTVRVLGDLLPPAISLLTPQDGDSITAPTDIVGTVTDGFLASYEVAMRRGGDSTWQTVASDTQAVQDGVLGRIDPTQLMNGQYAVRVRAFDLNGNGSEVMSSFVVEGDLKVGNFAFTVEDVNVPVDGIPVRVSRTYDTRRRLESGDFGFGWSLDMTSVRLQESRVPGQEWRQTVTGAIVGIYCVRPLVKHRVTVTLPDGSVEKFLLGLKPECKSFIPPAEMEPLYTPEPGTTSKLEAVQADGKPFTHLTYNGGSLLDGLTAQVFNPSRYRLTTRRGYVYDIHEQFGITKATTPTGQTLTFTPDGVFHSSGVSVSFTRDSQNRITALTDPNGNVQHYTYDAAGDLASHDDALANVTRYEYADATFAHAMTAIRDPLNRPLVKNIFDADGRMIAQEDNAGNRTDFEHNIDGRYSIVSDRNGNRSILEYNDRGDVTRKTDALNHVWQYSYDAFGNLLTETDPLGRTSTRVLNDSDDVLSVTDPLGNTTSFTYNVRGQELTITDALGRTHTNAYDFVGNLLSVTDPAGNEASSSVGARGLPLSSTDLMGNRTLYVYDSQGRKTSETDPLGHVTTWTYDASGNALTETKQRTVNGVLVNETTAYVYDAKNRVVQTRMPDGSVSRSEYDAAGNEVVQTDALGHRTEMTYDAYGRLSETRFPDGTTESKVYDAEGNLVSETDRNGQVTRFVYDGNDRLVRTTYPDGTSTETEYDAAGQVLAERDARGHVTTHAYDAAGRRTHTTDALGGVTAFAYDANGNLIEQTDPNGNATRYEYNLLDQRVKTLLPDGTTLQDTFDAEDRRLTSRDPVGLVTTYRYDALGRLTQVLDAAGFVTAFGYDEHGNKVSQTDAESRVSTFAHDALGREVANTLPLGQQAFTTYDAAGNVATQTDYNGATTTFTYDANGRTTRIDYADGTVESFTYDANGNRLSATNAQGTTSYQYDARHRLVREDRPDGSALTYAYDAAGNRTRVTASGHGKSATTRYTYDARNRLATVTDEQGGVTTHTYDAAGNLDTLTFPNGLVTTYTHDELNRPLSVSTRNANGNIVGSETYTLHPTGRRTQVVSFDGNTITTQQYRYDLLYRLFEESTRDGAGTLLYSATYTYDRVGNRVYAIEDGVHTQYSYDANDRLLGAGGVSYAYDNAGNLLAETQDGQSKTYTWDAKHKLARAGTPQALVDYLYDVDGIRSAKFVNGQRTDYVVDHNTAYAQVLLEADPSGTAAYTRGLALLGQERDGASSYYHADALGSTKQLTDATGTTTDRYAYTAFGKPQSATGSTPNSYRYTGEQFDDSLGQY